MHTLLFAVLAIICGSAYGCGIYFYTDLEQKKCFLERMPKHTVFMGNFSASLVSESPITNNINALRTQITVESNGEVVMSQQLGAFGTFFFTSTLAADHLVCLRTSRDISYNWRSGTKERVKFRLGVYVGDPGETSIVSPVEQKLSDLLAKLQNMNSMISEIRKDQYNHRARESDFRDKSESVSSSIGYWIIVQLIFLIGSGVWQANNLRGFFRTKKLI